MKKSSPWLAMASIICYGCSPKTIPAYYSSPLDINSSYYNTIPLQSEGIAAATYSNFAMTAGSSNRALTDNLYAFKAGMHRSHNFGPLQGYYGGNLTLGSYHMRDYYRIKYTPSGMLGNYLADTVFHVEKNNLFFGAYGMNGGLNVVIPYQRNKGEWRVGLQTAWQHEFGNYLNFRKSLPDSSVDIRATDVWTKQLGFTSEWVRQNTHVQFGYKFAIGMSFVTDGHYSGDSSHLKPFYIANTIHLTKGSVTGFCQLNAGNKTATFQTGINYRIGHKARKP